MTTVDTYTIIPTLCLNLLSQATEDFKPGGMYKDQRSRERDRLVAESSFPMYYRFLEVLWVKNSPDKVLNSSLNGGFFRRRRSCDVPSETLKLENELI